MKARRCKLYFNKTFDFDDLAKITWDSQCHLYLDKPDRLLEGNKMFVSMILTSEHDEHFERWKTHFNDIGELISVEELTDSPFVDTEKYKDGDMAGDSYIGATHQMYMYFEDIVLANLSDD